MWKPFDTRFRELLDRIQRHRALFDMEMGLHDQELLIKHFKEFKKFVDKTEMVNTTSQKIEKAREQLAMSKLYGFKMC
jgi:hypothetical protein